MKKDDRQKSVLIIVNPVAGTLKAKRSILDIIDIFCKAGYEPVVVTTQHRGHCMELASRAKERGFGLIVCSGGDGTLNEAITGVIKSGSDIPLGYIPQGSTNDFASTLGLSADPAECAAKITELRPVKLDIGRFNGDQCFSYIASFGAFTDASYNVPQEVKNVLGHFAYVLGGISELGDIRATHIKVTCESGTFEDDFIFGAVSNTTSVAGIVKLDSHIVDLQDGIFEVILIKNPTSLFELNDILTGITNSDFRSGMFRFMKASRIEFETDPGLKWSLDGEAADSDGHVLIENLHGAVTLYK